MVGAARPEHIPLLLLQRLQPEDGLAQAEQLRHHPSGQTAGGLSIVDPG